MKKQTILPGKMLRLTSIAMTALFIGFTYLEVQAATGDELLMGALPASAMNKSAIEGETLTKAVYEAVISNKEQAPEIVAAAIPKTRSMATQKAIVKAAISALGDYKSLPKRLIPQIVYAAIKAAPNCGGSDGKSSYSKDGYAKDARGGCDCAEEFTKSAIESLGSDPSERLVNDIVTSAIQATDGRCADRVANAASEAAPQYASSIADAAARAGAGGPAGADDFGGDLVFSPTGRPVPAPFTFPPATNGGIVPDTTPVN